MSYRLRAVSYADGRSIGPMKRWLGPRSDVDTHNGRGYADLVFVGSQAKTFASQAEAHAFWTQISTRRPRRPDGEPNRPLTAFTVMIEPVEEDP